MASIHSTPSMSYDDASGSCRMCGMKQKHADPVDCVESMVKVIPKKSVPRVIAFLREEIAMCPDRRGSKAYA